MVKEELGMKGAHRELIKRNLDRLVALTNYEELMNECVKSRLLTVRMHDIIERLKNSQDELEGDELRAERHKDLLIKITKRGPTAFTLLKEMLKNLKCYEALRLLEQVDTEDDDGERVWQQSNFNGMSMITPPRVIVSEPLENKDLRAENYPALEPCTPTQLTKVVRKVTKSDRLHVNPIVGCYPMRSRNNRGVLFLANIIDFKDPDIKRNAAEEDARSLEDLFTQMGFIVFSYTNLTRSNFFYLLDKLIKSDYARDTECFVLALMTHGNRVNERDIVEFHDGAIVQVNEIMNCFLNEYSTNLIDKPKILIFPFCRGDTPDFGYNIKQYRPATANQLLVPKITETDSIAAITNSFQHVASLSDTIVCYASAPGFQTHRDPLSGSWYIQKFCDVMAQHAHNTNFQDILLMTQRQTGNMRSIKGSLQAGCFENRGFSRSLYFNPGYWEE